MNQIHFVGKLDTRILQRLALNYNNGLTWVWTKALYQNKNIIPFTETQNRSNEENILLLHY